MLGGAMQRVEFGCRDCRTCTMPGFVRFWYKLMFGLLYVYTCGIGWVVKRSSWRHCPNCRHTLRRHLTDVPAVAVVQQVPARPIR